MILIPHWKKQFSILITDEVLKLDKSSDITLQKANIYAISVTEELSNFDKSIDLR